MQALVGDFLLSWSAAIDPRKFAPASPEPADLGEF